jgi:hypothetical protein
MNALYRTGCHSGNSDRSEFFAGVLEMMDIPEDAWSVFRKTLMYPDKSFGVILSRSETTAARAFQFLSNPNQNRVRATLFSQAYVPKEIMLKIIVHMMK